MKFHNWVELGNGRAQGSVARLASYVAVLLLVSPSGAGYAGVIPAGSLVDWTPGVRVGVVGGIPTYRTNLIDITKSPYNADNTGVRDAQPAVQSAISAAHSNDVLYLPPGIYCMSNGITPKSDITIRGAGPNSTTLLFYTKGSALIVRDNGSANFAPGAGSAIISGGRAGSTNITVADTSAFNIGGVVQIAIPNSTNQYNDPVTVSVSGFNYLRQQVVVLVAKTPSVLTVWPPLCQDFTGGVIGAGNARLGGIGVEDLAMNGSNSAATFACFYVGVSGSWFKNVHLTQVNNIIVDWEQCANCEFRDSQVGPLISQNGPNHSGFRIVQSSGILFQNNVVLNAFPHVEVNSGSSGCVFAFNFCYDSSTYGSEGVSIDSNHDPHNQFNLYEGNIAPNLQCDGYFGSTSHDTVYRNWFHGTEPLLTGVGWCLSLNRFTRDYNLIGNIFGTNVPMTSTSTSFGNPNIGNSSYSGYGPPWASWGTSPGPGGFQELDTNVVNSTLRLDNYYWFSKSVPSTETLGTNTLPNSMYLAARPAWFGSLAWPPIDPTNPNIGFDTIPAGYRYVHGTDPPGVGDQTPPTAPSGLAASAAGPTSVNLNWTASTDNVGVTGYLIERSQGANSSNFAQVGTTANTSFTDTGLSPSTTYNYRVRATDAAGNLSAYSNVGTAATLADQTPPSTPNGLTVVAVSTNQINLTWAASTDNVGVANYLVERSQGQGSSAFVQIATPAGTSYNDSSLSSGTVYNYRLRAVDGAGNLSAYSSIVTATTLPGSDTTSPSAPSGLTATAVGASQVDLGWIASTDNVGVTAYLVERSVGSGSTSFSQIGTASGTSFADTQLSPVTIYNYRIRATDAAGNLSGYSAVATATTGAQTATPGLVAAYTFDEGSGTVAGDSSGNGNTGSVSGAVWTSAGRFGGALQFDGTNAVVLVNDAPSLDLTSAVTLEAWVYPAAINGGWQTAVYKPSSTGVHYVLQGASRGTNVPSFAVSGMSLNLFGTSVLPTNTWSHVAGTYDGTNVQLYVNGVLAASSPQSGTMSPSTAALKIGASWPGLIDEVRIYNRALTQTEISNDMASPIGPRPAPPTNLRVVSGP